MGSGTERITVSLATLSLHPPPPTLLLAPNHLQASTICLGSSSSACSLPLQVAGAERQLRAQGQPTELPGRQHTPCLPLHVYWPVGSKGTVGGPSRSCLGCIHPCKETDWQGSVTPPAVAEVSSLGRSSTWLSVHFTLSQLCVPDYPLAMRLEASSCRGEIGLSRHSKSVFGE